MPLIHRIQQRTGNPLARSDQHLEAELVKLRALCEA
ncbi:unnamed protein product [Laminaria digitata]